MKNPLVVLKANPTSGVLGRDSVSNPDTRSDDETGRYPTGSVNGFAQRVHEKSMTVGFALCAAALVFLVAVSSTETILHFRAAESASQKASAALAFASELRARTDRELNSVLYLGSGIVGYLAVRHDQTDADEFNRILAAVYGYGRHIRNLALAVGYRITYVHPLAGNAQAIGRDYRELAAQWPSVRRAIESRSVVLTGPVMLVQGGTGLIYRVPVFVGDQYWGILSTVIDIPSLQEAAFKGLDSEHFEFAIRIEEEGGTGGGMLWGKQELLTDPGAVLLEAPMPNGRWIYGVRATQSSSNALNWAIRSLGWILALLAGLSVVTVLRQRRELSRLAGFDSLTDLPNRRLFDDRLEQSLRRYERNGIGLVAVVFLDLNGFKSINDRYGHTVGDRVLQTVAARIREQVRLGDTVSRWAGDEYALIVEDTSENHVDQLIERLHHRIEAPFELDGLTLTVSAAIGAAYYPDEAATSAELLELADQRMYENKNRMKRSTGKR